MKLSSLALTLALLPAALFAAGGNTGGSTTPASPTVIPGGSFAAAYVISAPGSYVLGGNRSADASTYVIEIAAPDVTLDLNGFKLTNAQITSTIGGGIYIPTPENVEIRNGSIVHPGNYGIRAKAGKGVRVIDVRVAGAEYAGIQIEAAAAQVERCHVSDSANHGIYTNGAGSLVADSVVNGFGTASGVTVSTGSRVVRTVVRGCGTGISVHTASTAVDCVATGNTVGFSLSDCSTLRDSESVKNTNGVHSSQGTSVIMGSRITHNTSTFTGGIGYYTNGGGNVIQ